MRWVHRIFALAVLGPVAIWLVLFAAVALLSGVAGCTIHEGFANPCEVFGRDVGDLAYQLGFWATWGGILILLPFAMFAGLVWVLVIAVAAFLRRK